MPKKKSNLKKIKQPQDFIKKEGIKVSKLEIKNYENEKVFDSEKTEFLRRKKRRGNIKNDNTSLPSSMKNLINKYGDVMANIGDKDMFKYEVFKKYNKNKKSKK